MNFLSLNLATSPFSYPQNQFDSSYNSGQGPVVISLFTPPQAFWVAGYTQFRNHFTIS